MSPEAASAQPRQRPLSVAAATLRSVGRIFGIVLGVALLLGLGICYWAGLFDSVELSEQQIGPWQTIYRRQTGPYEGIRYAIRNVVLYAEQKRGVKPSRGFAVFLDEGTEVEHASLRSIAGCILDSALGTPDTPYVCERIEEFEAVVGTFRLRSFFSYMTGVFKFYPALQQYLREEQLELAGPVVEVYDMGRKRIEYIAPLDRAPFVPDTVPLPMVVEEQTDGHDGE